MPNLIISLGTKKVPIQDRFTLINGKFKSNVLAIYKNEKFLKISEDLNKIPIEQFIDVFQEESKKYHDLKKSIKLLDFIHEYREISIKNIELCSSYNEIGQNLVSITKFITFLKKREFLSKELKISENQQKTSDFKALLDLSNKLNESIHSNQNKLQFLERDYFLHKNQIDQFTETIQEYKLRIQELNKQKKYCFSQINRITREMSGDSQEQKKELIETSNTEKPLTFAEKIKSFQRKAKDIQFEINKINSSISKTQSNLEESTPLYEIYKGDYQKILELIKSEEKKIVNLESDFKKKIEDNIDNPIQELEVINLHSLRPSHEIKEEIQNVTTELNEILIPRIIYNPDNPYDLSLFHEKLAEIEEYLSNRESEFVIKKSEKEIMDCFKNFRKLEFILNEIESLINKFLLLINLKSEFTITVNKDDKFFFIIIKFIRNNKYMINFEELTTPEKIFFIIGFSISIKLQAKKENVIFSNSCIPRKYNKAGSIFRTFRKILPLFENEGELSQYNLILIISNLEMKKKIKNLKIVTIQES